MNREFEMVRQFHQKFNHPVGDKPQLLDDSRVKARCNWMMEEIIEFAQATSKRDIVEAADAIIDAIYFCIGTLVEMGIRPDNLFEIVNTANMSKLWEDGKPHYKENGKVMKPSTWIDPHPLMEEEINRQIAEFNSDTPILDSINRE